MKTIFTLLASLIMSISVFAADARPKSSLTVRSSDNGDVRVVLDGKRFEPGTNKLMITDLNSGQHTIKIYRQKNSGFFSIVGKRYEVVYNTSLNVRAGTMITITIDRNGRTSMQESKLRRDRSGRDRDWNDRDLDNDRDFDYEHDGQWGDYNSEPDFGRGMSDREFNQVVQSISREWLETNKLKSATQIVSANSLTSAQVKQLVLLFNFESNKLDLAKQAYRNTVDKRNYYMINDAFSFNNSKDELARYIRNFR